MSWREKLFVAAAASGPELQARLHATAKEDLAHILANRRHQFLGETPVVLRSRKYKHGGEVRDERVAVIKPQLHSVKLYSLIMGRKVEVKTTPHMLRYIEALGGLDDYLLQTPDRKLFSDVASRLKYEVTQLYRARGLSCGAGLIMQRRRELEQARRDSSTAMLKAGGAPARGGGQTQDASAS